MKKMHRILNYKKQAIICSHLSIQDIKHLDSSDEI